MDTLYAQQLAPLICFAPLDHRLKSADYFAEQQSSCMQRAFAEDKYQLNSTAVAASVC